MVMANPKQASIHDELHKACLLNNSETNMRTYKSRLTQLGLTSINKWSSPFKNDSGVFQVIDFFSGCGGMSLGFAALSQEIPFFEIVGGCDIDDDALASFSTNLNSTVVNQDIRDLVDDNDALADFLAKLPRYNPKKPLILIGCAPCQGFTSHRKKNWEEIDERNTLVGAFASIAVKLDPECIVMENVPELLGKKYWDDFKEARTIFEKHGYIVKQNIYSAASFGTPQERFRAVVIAHKKNFLLPETIYDSQQYRTVRDAIGDLPKVSPGDPHPDDRYHRSARHRKSTLQTIRAVPQDGGSRPAGIGPKCLDKVKGFSDVYGRLYWDRPAITITHYARNPASGRFVHPEQHRGLTMREAARLQGFPDGFEFCGSFDSVFKQIGESVPPQLSYAVAANVLVELISSEPSEKEEDNNVNPITEPVSSSYSSVIAGIKMKRKGD